MKNFMSVAIGEAKKAFNEGEVPIGACIVSDGKVIARAHNQREKNQDATGHAELLAIRKACKKLNSWRLNGCEIYVTVEPCPMCAGAIINARLDKVIFGAVDTVSGCAGSVYNLFLEPILNHKTEAEGGLMADDCAQLMKTFFKDKRG